MQSRLIVLLAILAACSSDPTDGESTPTLTSNASSATSNPKPSPSPVSDSDHARCGYMGYGDAVGYAAFAANPSYYDAIHPDWWAIGADSVSVVPRPRGTDDARVLDAARAGHVQLIPLVAGVDDPKRIVKMLGDASLRTAHVRALTEVAVSKGYDGLDIDYEHLPESARAGYTAFMTELAAALHAKGKELSAAIYGQVREGRSAYDYVALARVVDHLHIMGYDYHWAGSHQGPVAPLGWIQAVARHAAESGDPNKFILALPNYGYSATSYCALGDCTSQCRGAIATTTVEMQGCDFNHDDHFAAGRVPNCDTADGRLYFEDSASLEEKVDAAASAGLGGIGYWTIGKEPRGFHDMVRRYY